MFKNLSKVTLILLFVTACNSAPVSNSKMEDIMYDIMIMEAGNQVKYNFGQLPKAKWSGDYQVIGQKHKVDSNTLKKAFTYYSKNPEVFSKVMEETITKLQEKQLMPDTTQAKP